MVLKAIGNVNIMRNNPENDKNNWKPGKVQQRNGNPKPKKKQPRKFKVGDIVSIKIDCVDKTSPLHSNLLLGKVEEIVNTYARVVTKFGGINTLISPMRLYPCTATSHNIELDYTTELTFSAACKKAM